jgi:glyoxylase-like metal-dependent hydrolase (beta-lactamase superfamily II)
VSTHARVTIDADVTPQFTACYLRLAPSECAFIEAHTSHAVPRLLAALAQNDRRPEDVRWVIVTHAHLDHAAGAHALLELCPNAVLLAHPRAAKHLVRPEKLVLGATAVYGEERFRRLYGTVAPIAPERVRSLADGESFDLGGARLTAWHTAGHAYHHLVIDDPGIESVYTGDTFGLVYPALQKFGRFAVPSTSPTGFHAAEARKGLDKVLALGERFVCPTHFGAYDDGPAIAAQLRRFIDRAELWVQQAAQGDDPLASIEAQMQDRWWRAIAEEQPLFGPEEAALLALDVELNAQGLAYASLTDRSRGSP